MYVGTYKRCPFLHLVSPIALLLPYTVWPRLAPSAVGDLAAAAIATALVSSKQIHCQYIQQSSRSNT